MDERVPRDPVGGDMVGIGFLTRPGHTATAVALHWTRNGRRQPPIGGRALARYADFDRWLAEIGVVEAGGTPAALFFSHTPAPRHGPGRYPSA